MYLVIFISCCGAKLDFKCLFGYIESPYLSGDDIKKYEKPLSAACVRSNVCRDYQELCRTLTKWNIKYESDVTSPHCLTSDDANAII